MLSFKKTKLPLSIIAWMLVVLLIVLALSTGSLLHVSHGLNNVGSWLESHSLWLLAWRFLILATFFFTWPLYVQYKAKKQGWPEPHIKRTKNLRYILVVFLLGIQLLFQWSAS